MGMLDRGSRAGFAVSMLVVRGIFALFVVWLGTAVVGGILGVLLPTGISTTLGALIALGLLGVHYARTWPVWGTTLEHRAYNDFNLENRSERIDPDEVAEVLSAIGSQMTDDGRLKGVNTRAAVKLTEAVYHGTRGDEDAQRVIAQFARLEGVSTERAETMAMDRLTALFDAGERPLLGRTFWTIRSLGWFLIRKSSEGLNDETARWSDVLSARERIQVPTVQVVSDFASFAPPDETTMRKAMDAESEVIRGHAAVAYGRRALFEPDRSGEIASVLVPLTNDPEKGVRLGATYGLEAPAYYDATARDRLAELRDGPDPDLREAADECLTSVEQALGNDGMNVDGTPEEHAADPDELETHAADLDAALNDEPAERELRR